MAEEATVAGEEVGVTATAKDPNKSKRLNKKKWRRGSLEITMGSTSHGISEPNPTYTVVVKGKKGPAKGIKRVVSDIRYTTTVRKLKLGKYKLRLRATTTEDGRRYTPGSGHKISPFRITKREPHAGAWLEVDEHLAQRTASGKVIDTDGRPVPDLPICAEYGGARYSSPVRDCSGVTREDGTYDFSYGKQDMSLGMYDYSQWSWPLKLTAGNPVADVPWKTTTINSKVSVVEPRGFITGTVSDQTGKQAAGVKVCGRLLSPIYWALLWDSQNVCGSSNEKGTYSLRVDEYASLFIKNSGRSVVLQSLFDEKMDWLVSSDDWAGQDWNGKPSAKGLFGDGGEEQEVKADAEVGSRVNVNVVKLERTSNSVIAGETGIGGILVCAASLDDAKCVTSNSAGGYRIGLPMKVVEGDGANPQPISVGVPGDIDTVAQTINTQVTPGQAAQVDIDVKAWTRMGFDIAEDDPINDTAWLCLTKTKLPDEPTLSDGQQLCSTLSYFYTTPLTPEKSFTVEPGKYYLAYGKASGWGGTDVEYFNSDGSNGWETAEELEFVDGQKLVITRN